jgi:hypothetical protein
MMIKGSGSAILLPIYSLNAFPHSFNLCMICYLASADLQLVVDTGVEVVEDNHLALWPEAGLLLQPHPHEGLDAGRPRDPTHGRHAS